MMIRWLHISDIHERKRDEHHRQHMFDEIIEKGIKGNPAPDMVFLTGDMAFAGEESEYLSLEEKFIKPLKTVLPAGCPVFTIPGNHDVNRKQALEPHLWFDKPGLAAQFHSTDSSGALFRRQLLLPRFAAYAAFDLRVSAWPSPSGSSWLASEVGSTWWSKKINGKMVAVVGINTAWLCQDEHDYGRLTPGRELLHAALSEARKSNPDLLIVLGHHPLSTMIGDGDYADSDRVQMRLEQANAIYLHGHRHRSNSGRLGYGKRQVLTIQAPSAYQAHDNPRWRNGLMWGEANITAGSLIIQPRIWNEDTSEFNWDTGAGYEEDQAKERQGYRVALPGHQQTGFVATPTYSPPLPVGWEKIDADRLKAFREDAPNEEKMADYFDGTWPSWDVVLANRVTKLHVANRAIGSLRAAFTGARKPVAALLTGGGGEGKSTALLHATAALIEDDQQKWTCLWRRASYATLPETLFAELLPIDGHAWVVTIDEADNVASEILDAVKKLGARLDVHLLLAARDAEWKANSPNQSKWLNAIDFKSIPVAGLDKSDAVKIVTAWKSYESDTANLNDQTIEQAADKLVPYAHDETVNSQEGALLGALLIARRGERLHQRVRNFFNRLDNRPVINNFSLRDIYAMIAAMHAENQLYLSRPILAFALGCEVEQLTLDALRPLQYEAKIVESGDTQVLTRHRRIAEVACEVMREDKLLIDDLYPFLAAKALRLFLKRRDVPEIASWCNTLPDHFVKNGRWAVARKTARALYNADPKTGHRVTVLSSVLRQTDRSDEALELLKSTGTSAQKDLALLYEWAAVAGSMGNYGLNAWLGGKTIADGGNLDSKRCKLSLTGLGVAFKKLSESAAASASERQIYLDALSACGQLGLRFPDLSARDEGDFMRYVEEGRPANRSSVKIDQADQVIRIAVVAGAYSVDSNDDQIFYERLIGDPESYTYSSLLHIVGLRGKKSF